MDVNQQVHMVLFSAEFDQGGNKKTGTEKPFLFNCARISKIKKGLWYDWANEALANAAYFKLYRHKITKSTKARQEVHLE